MKANYVLVGSGSKTLVFLHGFMEDLTMWNEFIAYFSQDYRVLAIDLLGHGKTPCELSTITMHDQSQLIYDIFELEKIPQALFIGHSMGGYVLLDFIARYPEKATGFSLFFSTPLADSDEKKQQRDKSIELVQTNRESFIRNSIPLLFKDGRKGDNAVGIQQTIQMAQSCKECNIIGSIRGMRDRKDQLILLKSDLPKQLLLGRFDSTQTSEQKERMIQAINNGVVEDIDCGHMGHFEATEACKVSLENFFSKVLF